MADADTIAVKWKDKFGDQIVNISPADYDPKIHKHVTDEELKAAADKAAAAAAHKSGAKHGA